MKIDEPKTPYVRYDAENDRVLDGESALSPQSGAVLTTDVPEFDLRNEGTTHSPRSPGRNR